MKSELSREDRLFPPISQRSCKNYPLTGNPASSGQVPHNREGTLKRNVYSWPGSGGLCVRINTSREGELCSQFLRRKAHALTLNVQAIASSQKLKVCVKEIHLRNSDKPRSVSERHRFRLVVGNLDERGIDSLAELEGKSHIVIHAHVRVERVTLEDHHCRFSAARRSD